MGPKSTQILYKVSIFLYLSTTAPAPALARLLGFARSLATATAASTARAGTRDLGIVRIK